MMKWVKEKEKKKESKKSSHETQTSKVLKTSTIVSSKNGKFQTGLKSNQWTKMKKRWTWSILASVKEQIFTTLITWQKLNSSKQLKMEWITKKPLQLTTREDKRELMKEDQCTPMRIKNMMLRTQAKNLIKSNLTQPPLFQNNNKKMSTF